MKTTKPRRPKKRTILTTQIHGNYITVRLVRCDGDTFEIYVFHPMFGEMLWNTNLNMEDAMECYTKRIHRLTF